MHTQTADSSRLAQQEYRPLPASAAVAGYRSTHSASMCSTETVTKGGTPVIILRRVIGDELRRRRQDQGRTLREVSSAARVSLGYLSEVERGQKEASSELLASICTALDVPISTVMPSLPPRASTVNSVSVRPSRDTPMAVRALTAPYHDDALV